MNTEILFCGDAHGEFAHILMEDVYWRTRAKMKRLVETRERSLAGGGNPLRAASATKRTRRPDSTRELPAIEAASEDAAPESAFLPVFNNTRIAEGQHLIELAGALLHHANILPAFKLALAVLS